MKPTRFAAKLVDSRAPMPSFVRVGPIKYRVVVKDDKLTDCPDTNTDGQILYEEAIIEIARRKNTNPIYEKTVMLHEIVHAIITQSGHRQTDDENLVNSIAYALVDIIQNNPDLLTYLLHPTSEPG
jgi:hypothetical protein